MSNVKIYIVEHEPTGGSITVEIDFDHVSVIAGEERAPHGLIKDMVDFWMNSETRLNQNSGVYFPTFLKMLCQECLEIYNSMPCSVNKLVEQFNNREGYCRMDGSRGFKITAIEGMDVYTQEHYSIKEFFPCVES